jgi:hypothetical protein
MGLGCETLAHARTIFNGCSKFLGLEVLGGLVSPAVFKIVGPTVKRLAGGFDSHALPFRFLLEELSVPPERA